MDYIQVRHPLKLLARKLTLYMQQQYLHFQIFINKIVLKIFRQISDYVEYSIL